jgi:hypothetical protein
VRALRADWILSRLVAIPVCYYYKRKKEVIVCYGADVIIKLRYFAVYNYH